MKGRQGDRMERINSIRCQHTCLMYIHIIHGCDATFLCGFPPRTVSRDALLLIYQSVYCRPTLIACKPGCVLGFRGVHVHRNEYTVPCAFLTESSLSAWRNRHLSIFKATYANLSTFIYKHLSELQLFGDHHVPSWKMYITHQSMERKRREEDKKR